MGLLRRLMPRPVRIVTRTVRHPVRTGIRAVTPRPVRKVKHAVGMFTSPIGTAQNALEREVAKALKGSTSGRSSRPRSSTSRRVPPRAAPLSAPQPAGGSTSKEFEFHRILDSLVRMTSSHEQGFELKKPLPPPPITVDRAAILEDARRQTLAGIPAWRVIERGRARARALNLAQIRGVVAQSEADQTWSRQLRAIDEEWAKLFENDPGVVRHTLQAAFSDNASRTLILDLAHDDATVGVVMDSVDALPTRKPGRTQTGRPSLRQWGRKDRNVFYMGVVGSTVLATVKEAFAVAPGLGSVTTIVLRHSPPPAAGLRSTLDIMYRGVFERERYERTDWNKLEPAEELARAEHFVALNPKTAAFLPLDLSALPEMHSLLLQLAEVFSCDPLVGRLLPPDPQAARRSAVKETREPAELNDRDWIESRAWIDWEALDVVRGLTWRGESG